MSDSERGEYCPKNRSPSRINYYFFSQELYDLNMAARRKKADRLCRKAASLLVDQYKGKKLKKSYEIGNDPIDAHITLQTNLTIMAGEEARKFIQGRTMDGREDSSA